jgi:hypothetical protein
METKQGTLNRWWRQVLEMTHSMQKRICNETNMQKAMDLFKQRQKSAAEYGEKLKARIISNGENNGESEEPNAPMSPPPMPLMVPSEVYEIMMALGADPDELYEPMPKLGRGDPEAIDAILKMFEDGLTPGEILVLAHSRPTEPDQLTTAQEEANYEQWYIGNRTMQNPNFDQPAMDEMYAIDKIGPSRTKELFIGDKGQQTQLEQSRQQTLETAALMGGSNVPVSPRDDHVIHLQTGQSEIQPQIESMKATPPVNVQDSEIQGVARQIDHAKSHVAQLATNKKTPPEVLIQQQDWIKQAFNTLSDINSAKQKDLALAAAMQQRQQAAAMNQPFEPSQTQTSPNGQPVVTPAILDALQKQSEQAHRKLARRK